MIYLLNSIEFVLFFILVFILYWTVPGAFKKYFLLIASYLFYASWNWKFLSLIFISTVMNYFCGLAIYKSGNAGFRKFLLALSIATDLSILAFFKYFHFFADNLSALMNSLGLGFNFSTLNIILPLGISFYTFETIGYIADVYGKKFTPVESFTDFALFVAYFPKLISGPIERAKKLIPQIQSKKQFRDIKFKEGLYLFIYGLFKKIVIADSVAAIANNVFAMNNPSGAQILIAAYAFAIQLYCDFSGYIDMARGISYFFGIELSANFNIPYFAKNPHDFWSRWHTTLSSWVRDYIYIPLGGHNAKFLAALPLLAAWFMMGLWHGAAWNFVLWGIYWFIIVFVYHAFKLIRFNLTRDKDKKKAFLGGKADFFKILIMFHITAFGWIIFRSKSLAQAASFTKSLISGISIPSLLNADYAFLYVAALFLIIYESLQYFQNDETFIYKKNFYLQMVFYISLFFIYVEVYSASNVNFLYFQF